MSKLSLLVFLGLALLFIAPSLLVWRPWNVRVVKRNKAGGRPWTLLGWSMDGAFLAVVAVFGLCVVTMVAITACSSGLNPATIATTLEDVDGAVCTILEGIPATDTQDVQFVCTALPKPGTTGVPKTFRVKIKAADAKAFSEAHCGAAKVSP